MRFKEQRLWDRFRSHRPAFVRLERVENMLAAGFPDVIAQVRLSSSTWLVELKAVSSLPVRPTTAVFGDKDGLTVDQRNWLLDWMHFGGHALILGASGEGAHAIHWLIPGSLADAFNDMTLAELRVSSLIADEDGRRFWPALFTYLEEN